MQESNFILYKTQLDYKMLHSERSLFCSCDRSPNFHMYVTGLFQPKFVYKASEKFKFLKLPTDVAFALVVEVATVDLELQLRVST